MSQGDCGERTKSMHGAEFGWVSLTLGKIGLTTSSTFSPSLIISRRAKCWSWKAFKGLSCLGVCEYTQRKWRTGVGRRAMWYATPTSIKDLWDCFEKSPLLSLRADSSQQHTGTCYRPPPAPRSALSLQRWSVLSRLSEVRHACPHTVPAVFPLRPAPVEIQGDIATSASSLQSKRPQPV